MVDAGDKSGARRKQLVGGGLTLLAALLGYYFWDDHHPEGTVIDTPMVPASIDPQRNDPTKDPPASPERAAILKDLKVGSVVSGWTIAALTISTKYDTKDALAVVLVNGKKSFAVWILPRGQSKIGAQFGTANYVLHTGLLTETAKSEITAPIGVMLKQILTFEGTPDPPPDMGSVCPPQSAAPSASAPPSAAASAPPR